MTLRWENIVIDCADTKLVGRFWAAVFEVPLQGPDDDVYWIEPGDVVPEIMFIPVPEAKSVKNRLHIDVRGENRDAEVARLEELGARRIDIGQGEVSWVVMADPEGNEFCVLRERPA